LLGDTGVGKSSLVLRFITNEFKPYVESTIGASFMSKLILVDSQPIKFQVLGLTFLSTGLWGCS
jgi:GTPase SAR1 family protein